MADSNGSDAKSGAKVGILGSLREALNAASREEEGRVIAANDTPDRKAQAINKETPAMATPPDDDAADNNQDAPPPLPSAAEAAREARGGTPNIPPVDQNGNTDPGAPPTTRVIKSSAQRTTDDEPRTQLVRGRQTVQRGEFKQDPVVGWLVVVGGPGIGAYRPIFEGNNTVGRAPSNRVPIDFGDESISGEEQAYVRYDSTDRSFLLVPNMSKTNVVSVNDKRPTAATALQTMDVITMGRTQLVFVPFCGAEFDWGELTNIKS